MKLDEQWMRAHLPEDCRNDDIDVFSGFYLDGLNVMAEGERGNPDTVEYAAKNEEDLRYWQLESICEFVGKADHSKIWRYYRHHAENGKWMYVEHRRYDYNAIEDPRFPGFERFLLNLRYGFPPDLWEDRVRRCIRLANYWYKTPHWDYDRKNMRFIEISDSREHDGDGIEEPRPGSIIEVVD